MGGLPRTSQALLRRVEREGELDPSQIAQAGVRTPASAIKELERRLLIHTEEVHTAKGAHARHLESWDRWQERVGWSGPTVTTRIGRERILEAVRSVCRASGGSCRLPWEKG